MNLDDIIRAEREKVAQWMIQRGYATGHGDTLEDLLAELDWQGRESEREECAKVCHDKAWELKERSIKETVKTQRARLASEAAGWHDAFTAIRARGQS